MKRSIILKHLVCAAALSRVNGKIEAFSFGKKINDDTAVLHVEKANPDIHRGIYAAINKDLPNMHGGCSLFKQKKIWGHEGLHTAKESYHPEFMIKKKKNIVFKWCKYGFSY